MNMSELEDESIHFIVTSPPYYNAPFDYKGLFENYDQYFGALKKVTKESLSTDTKATITIENYLGGKYYFTTDEIKLKDSNVYLIEGKHSRAEFLPSIGDIKDGLLKMILYSNLKDVLVDGEPMKSVPVLKLTSPKISGSFSSNSNEEKLDDFFQLNSFSKRQKRTIENFVEESRINNFLVLIERSN
ncbi:MAG: hypothetical protein GXO87_06965 [Chlorobi bacterium]|nr:hypothetical protein [Chlorobiota bacterium]